MISTAQEYQLVGFEKQPIDNNISSHPADCMESLKFSYDTLIVSIITQMSISIIPEPEESFELKNDTAFLNYTPEITIVDTIVEYNSYEMRYDTLYHSDITVDIKNFMRYRLKYKIVGLKALPGNIKFENKMISLCRN